MGKDLYSTVPESKLVFEKADEIIGFKLSNLCFNGPKKILTETINAQPAVFTMSIACLKTIENKLDKPLFVAGHSLGEYTALVAANAIDFTEAVKLIRERGRLMQEAPQSSKEGMAAIIGLDNEVIEDICTQVRLQRQNPYIQVANYNSPKQTVISGSIDALQMAMKLAEERGAKLATLLPVSRAFHTALMQPVAKKLERAISTVSFYDAKIPIISNVTGKPLTAANEIKSDLVKQICSPVLWVNSVEYMIESDVNTFIEIGPGKVLTGLIKHTNKSVKTVNLGNLNSIRSFLNTREGR
jgi:[acyl-carrier-protein] S-malonyltransferase